jgi:hypothetical protein
MGYNLQIRLMTFCHGLETAGAEKLALDECIICLIAGAVKAGAG